MDDGILGCGEEFGRSVKGAPGGVRGLASPSRVSAWRLCDVEFGGNVSSRGVFADEFGPAVADLVPRVRHGASADEYLSPRRRAKASFGRLKFPHTSH